MSSAIEATAKALVEFEAELERAKAEAADSKRRVMKDALDWAEGARLSAISKAQQMASEGVARAKEEAEAEAARIREKGEASLREFEGSISKRRDEAAKLAAARLLGGGE